MRARRWLGAAGLHLAEGWRSWRSWGEAHPLAASALLVAALKLALLVADPTVNLLPDSDRWLHEAVIGWGPALRSLGYPLGVRLLAVTTRSLVPLLLVQAVAGGMVAVAVGGVARTLLGVRPALALAAALVLAAAPLQLVGERSVAPDCLACVALTAWTLLGIGWLARRRLPALLLFAAAVVPVGALDHRLLPGAAGGVVAAILLAGTEAFVHRRGLPRRHLLRRAAHAVAALIVLGGGLAALRAATGLSLNAGRSPERKASVAPRRDPLRVAGLAASTWADALFTRAMDDDLRAERRAGPGLSPATIELLHDRFSTAVTPQWGRRQTLTRRWLAETTPWLRLLLLTPLIGLLAALVARPGRRLTALWLTLTALALLASALALGPMTTRALAPLEPVLVVLLALLVDAFGHRGGDEPLLIPVVDPKPALAAPRG